MAKEARISAKKLGELMMPDFCPACFWTKAHLRWNTAWNTFPQVFSHLDIYEKAMTDCCTKVTGKPPAWWSEVGDVVGPVECPTYQTFKMLAASGVLLTGSPDYILKLKDGSLAIIDFKTAFFKGQDDPLMPIYLTQLNAYAALAKHTGLGTTSKLGLLYFEPCTGPVYIADKGNYASDGIMLKLKIKLLLVEMDLPSVTKLTELMAKIFALRKCPPGRDGCPHCKANKELMSLWNLGTNPYLDM